MLRFTLLTCLIAFAATSQVFAQQPMEDVVYLKNGGFVRGTIIEQIPGESLKIQTRDGNVLVFTMNEIANVSKEIPNLPSSSSASVKAEIGTLFGLSHARGGWWYGNRTEVEVPSTLSVWLISSEVVAIGSEIDFYFNNGAYFLLRGNVAFSPSYTRPASIYVLGTGSYQRYRSFGIGTGMGLRASIGSALVLRMEGRYERWFEDEENVFSLLLGLGTQLGG